MNDFFYNYTWLVDQEHHKWLQLIHPSKWEGIQFY